MSCGAEEPAAFSADFTGDRLGLIPTPVLLKHVLPLLDSAAVVRLASCSRALAATALSDDVWRPRCEARGWGPFPRGVSWQAGFSSRRASLCVECGKPSRYVFALLGCRLCEGCEHTGLAPAGQAAVQGQAAELLGGRPAGSQESAGESTDEDADDEEQREGQAEGMEAGAEREARGEAGQPPEDSVRPGLRRNGLALTGVGLAAQAKEAQRLKRQLRIPPGTAGGGGGGGRVAAGSRGGGGGVLGSSPPSGAGFQGLKAQQPGGARGRRSAAVTFGSSPPGARAVGPLLVAQDDGDGLALPLEGQAVPLPRSRARGGGAGGGGGGAGGASGGGRPAKLKSGWAAEREALMADWGQFGISGLVLAS
ncbi:hypothetical protein GPECTOR_60g737 [Gonium pectorale]|uniref:F-box domain-containing protein n=1 Tax=Gonium pectorale TaxID=33097 RepID=A0A150G501_GONPE|nr:hypothetical protein GPECTOR_60g737 [Gonium pectorale]|eukprot:KXZ44959.1 hypothetical protein GPECTOR_60g737 [Gonium pectorale]